MTDVVQDQATVIDRSAEVKKILKREAWRRRIPILPALLFTIIVTQIPFVLSLFYSLTDWNIVSGVDRVFIGLGNYGDLLDSTLFRRAAWTTVIMTTSSVLLSVFFGTLVALLLDRKFFGQGFVRTLLITPFLITPVVASQTWSTSMLNPQFGVVNFLLGKVGVDDPIQFAGQFPTWTIVAVLVWQWTPFMMLIILAGLQGQDPSVLEAARVDGANSRAIFFQITLPQLRPFLELGTLLGSIYLIQVFDQVDVITGGGPGSTNLPYFVFERSIGGGWEFGQASAFSIVVVVATIIFATLGLRLLSNLLEE